MIMDIQKDLQNPYLLNSIERSIVRERKYKIHKSEGLYKGFENYNMKFIKVDNNGVEERKMDCCRHCLN